MPSCFHPVDASSPTRGSTASFCLHTYELLKSTALLVHGSTARKHIFIKAKNTKERMESNTVTFKNTVAAKLKKTSSKCLKQKTKMNSLTYVIGKVRLTGFRYSGIQVAKLCLGCWWLPCRPFSLTGRLCLCGNYGQG